MASCTDDQAITPEDEDPLDFAQHVLGRVSVLAADIGFNKKSATAGCLAAELWIAKQTIESVDPAQYAKLERRSFKLMRHLERICCWPTPPTYGQQSILRNLAQCSTYRAVQQAEERARIGLVKFLHSPDFVKQELIKILHSFSKISQSPPATTDRKATLETNIGPSDYPREVNTMLYKVLKAHSACNCTASQHSSRNHGRHAARLRLKADIIRLSEGFGFDLLMRSWPETQGHWQDVQLGVKLNSKKSVGYDGDATRHCAREPSRLLELGSLCDLINIRLESRLNLQVQNSELYQLYEGIPIQQRTSPVPSLPLRRVLDTYRLSNKMKLVLCYIIAHSFWQYYGSPWMNSVWSNESIHFLFESSPTSSREESLYASKPYFAVAFDTAEECFQEYCDSYSVIFRYPRIIELCVILLEIMRGRPFELERFNTAEAGINAKWNLAFCTVGDSNQWVNFEYNDFRSALQTCLESRTFDKASTRTGPGWNDLEHDLEQRRKIMYDVLIEPLHHLLRLLGFIDALNHIEPLRPIEPSLPRPKDPGIPRIPNPNTASTSLEVKETGAAIHWIEKIGQLHAHMLKSITHTNCEPQIRPTRIAVLDSGYDDNSTFFLPLVRSKRMKGWQDFAGNSNVPIDENGHGTHTVALVMKIAPTADIYVARIGRDRGSMGQAHHAICQAIKWATEECDVDIISMSFGFEFEVSEISVAIREAELVKRDKLLFFAAASNSGGNKREMFPASHDAVISIRQTNANGSFADTNPPADPHGPAVFGTLGSNVPSAWLGNIDGEVAKSGSSVATAIAAGTAAMMLSYANLGIAQTNQPITPEVRRLWTRRGMLSMFAKMSVDTGNRCLFLTPVKFLTEGARSLDLFWAGIVDACRW